MTSVRIHGILAREFGDSFMLNIGNPSDVLQAIDCNREGFIRRIIQLQKEGFGYDIIVNKTRIREGRQMNAHKNPEVIDLVPVIAGSGLEAIVFIFEKLITAVLFAAVAYALSPKPDQEALEAEAAASKQSLIFSNSVNVASQGAPVPVGYGRLIVGTQVIQATIKSYPQHSDPEYLLTDGLNETEDDTALQINQGLGGLEFDDPEGGPPPADVVVNSVGLPFQK